MNTRAASPIRKSPLKFRRTKHRCTRWWRPAHARSKVTDRRALVNQERAARESGGAAVGDKTVRVVMIGCGEHAESSHGPAQARYASKHPGTELGVRANLLELVGIERTRLVEDRPVELELADVVQRPPGLDRLDSAWLRSHGVGDP